MFQATDPDQERHKVKLRLFPLPVVRAAALLATAALAPPVFAHHAFTASFDCNAPVTLSGKVTTVEWVNPHAWVHIIVSAPGKPDQAWMVEGATPNTLLRAGLDRQMLKPGMAVTFRGYLGKDRSCAVALATHAPTCKADGRALSFDGVHWVQFGSEGEGAPFDEATMVMDGQALAQARLRAAALPPAPPPPAARSTSLTTSGGPTVSRDTNAAGRGAQNVNNIPMEVLQSVEVLKDGGHAYYGSGSDGGCPTSRETR